MTTKKTINAIKKHAESEYPKESCGFVVNVKNKEIYIPCENKADDPVNYFSISPEDYVAAEEQGDIVRIIHSHTGDGAMPIPSDLDKAICEESGIVWGIVSWPGGEYAEFEPQETPLVGRTFSLGGNDCYGLVMAWYKKQNIILPDYRKSYEWWEKDETLFTDENIKNAGFEYVESVEDAEPGDVIIMTIRANVPNHSGVLLPDDRLLHHMPNQLSRRVDFHHSYYWNRVVKVCRHTELKNKGDISWL